MTTDEIIDEIVKSKDADMIWKALCTNKVRSAIYHKYGLDLMDTGLLRPSFMEKLMETCIDEIVEVLMDRMGKRN